MPVDIYDTANALLKKLPEGWRTGTSQQIPVSLVKKNPHPPKWEDLGGVTHAELDLILRTSVDAQHAAQRIIDKVLLGISVVPGQGSNSNQQPSIDAIRSMIRQEINQAMATLQATMIKNSQTSTQVSEDSAPAHDDDESWKKIEETVVEVVPMREHPANVTDQDEHQVEPESASEGQEQEDGEDPAPAKKRGPTPKTRAQRLEEVELWKVRCEEMGRKLPVLDQDGLLAPHNLYDLRRRYKRWQKAQAGMA